MRVKLRFDVFIDEDDKSDCSAEFWWNTCDWSDVTAIEDCFLTALRKLNDLGYALAQEKSLVTDEQVAATKQIVRS